MSRCKIRNRPDIEITGGFVVIMAWLNYVSSLKFLLLALLAAIVHEAGHYSALRLFGGRVRIIRLSAVGVQMEQEGSLSYAKEIICTAAGPAVNLVVAFAAVFFAGDGGFVFAGLNLSMFILNMLPFSALDGGRCLFLLCAWCIGPTRSASVFQLIEWMLTVVLVCMGGFLFHRAGNVTLLIVAVWLFVQNTRIMFGCGRKRGCLSCLERVK